VPNVKWYVDIRDGKKTLNPWFRKQVEADELDNQFTPEITKIYYKYCKAFGHVLGKLSSKEFVEGLVGKKVFLKTKSDKYEGKRWTRIDVVDFVVAKK